MSKKLIIVTTIILIAFVFSSAGCGSDNTTTPAIPTFALNGGHQHVSVVKKINGVIQWCNGNSGLHPTPGTNQWTLWTVNGNNITADLYNEYGVKQFTHNIINQQP